MVKSELIKRLKALAGEGDPECVHGIADDLLLDFIGDDEVTEAFEAIDKWYA